MGYAARACEQYRSRVRQEDREPNRQPRRVGWPWRDAEPSGAAGRDGGGPAPEAAAVLERRTARRLAGRSHASVHGSYRPIVVSVRARAVSTQPVSAVRRAAGAAAHARQGGGREWAGG